MTSSRNKTQAQSRSLANVQVPAIGDTLGATFGDAHYGMPVRRMSFSGGSGWPGRVSSGGVDVLVEVEDVVWVVASLQLDETFPVGTVRGANA
jgi:hypothetical protein